MRYLNLEELLELHRMVLRQSGGTPGLRDPNGLDSALAQPRMTFGGEDLYPSLVEKAAALGFSLVMNTLSSTATSGSDTRRWKPS